MSDMPKYETTLDLILAFKGARARVHGADDPIQIEAVDDGLFRVAMRDGLKAGTFRRDAIERSIDSLNAQADKVERRAS